MEKNIFQLDNEQLKEIARSFKAKVEEGLNTCLLYTSLCAQLSLGPFIPKLQGQFA